MEAADGAAEVLHRDVLGGEDEVDAVAVVDGEAGGPRRGGDDLLDGEPREGATVGARGVLVLTGDDDGAGDVGARLVGVEGDSAPPLGHGGGRRRSGGPCGRGAAAGGGGDGVEEVLDDELLLGSPAAVPDDVEVDGGVGEDGAHVVAELDEVRRALESLRGGEREGSRRELRVVVLDLRVAGLGFQVQGLGLWRMGSERCIGGAEEEEEDEEGEGKTNVDRRHFSFSGRRPADGGGGEEGVCWWVVYKESREWRVSEERREKVWEGNGLETAAMGGGHPPSLFSSRGEHLRVLGFRSFWVHVF